MRASFARFGHSRHTVLPEPGASRTSPQADRRRIGGTASRAPASLRRKRDWANEMTGAVALAKRLIGYETVGAGAIAEAAGFVKGWLEARGIEAERDEVRGLPVLKAEVGPEEAPTVVLHGHIDVVPAHAGQFEPRLDGDRLYGRGAYDMKGALAAMLVDHRGDARPGRGAGAARDRRRRGVRGGGRARLRPPRRQRLRRRLRDHRRADRSAHRGRGQGGAGAAARGGGHGGPRRHALAGRQRRPQRDRRFPQYRVATVCPAQLGAVRPPLDQPRPDLGRRRAEQGARPMRDRRRHPLPARPGSRRDAGGGPGDARGRGDAAVHAGRRRPSTATRPSCGRCARRRRRTTTASR